MNTKKILILAMVLIAMVGTANAAVTVTVNTPTANQLFRPNLDGTTYVDLNITFIDSVSTNGEHELGITFATPDGNVWVTSDSNTARPGGTDQNMSSTECSFATANVWTTPGADCIIRYTFPTNPQLATGNYVLDVNGTAYTNGQTTAEGLAIQTFRIDNRFVDTSTETMLNILPVILIAALLIGIVLAGFGKLGGNTVLMLAIGAVVSIIAVVVLTLILNVLTP